MQQAEMALDREQPLFPYTANFKVAWIVFTSGLGGGGIQLLCVGLSYFVLVCFLVLKVRKR